MSLGYGELCRTSLDSFPLGDTGLRAGKILVKLAEGRGWKDAGVSRAFYLLDGEVTAEQAATLADALDGAIDPKTMTSASPRWSDALAVASGGGVYAVEYLAEAVGFLRGGAFRVERCEY